MKVGIIGNTQLTYNTIKFLLQKDCKIEYVFGLPDDKLKNKVNAYDLKSFCAQHEILYLNDNNWESIMDKNVDIVYEMGDSRIVPKSFLQRHRVVGNHGALLPYVQGAASLVWGRMLNNGQWGVSLMELNEEIDGGEILITREIFYEKNTTTMKEFVEMCDNATIQCVKEYFEGNIIHKQNKPWQVKIAKNVDSSKVVDILRLCLEKRVPVYLPTRRPKDGEINHEWETEFIEVFKISNDSPYPKAFNRKDEKCC